MFSDFKAFVKRGNVMDLAVGVIIGAAFGKIVSSLTDDLLMPVIGLITGGIDFKGLFYALDGKTYETLADAKKAKVAILAYGNFITTIIDFLLIAFVVFLLVKMVQRVLPPPPAPAPAPAGPTPTESLLTEIRDLLKK